MYRLMVLFVAALCLAHAGAARAVPLGPPAVANAMATPPADQARLSTMRLRAVQIADGSFALRPYDPYLGRELANFTLSDPSMQAQLDRALARRYATAAAAERSGRSYRGWLTRRANALGPAPADAPADPGPKPAASERPTPRDIGKQVGLSIPLIAAAGVANDLLGQAQANGIAHVSIGHALKSITEGPFLRAAGGAIAGGLTGELAGTLLSRFAGPLAPFVKAAGPIFGSMLGAHMANSAQVDWGRLAFDTAISAAVAVPLLAFGPVGGFVGGFVVGTAADKLYDILFHRSNPANVPDGPADRGAPRGVRGSQPRAGISMLEVTSAPAIP